MSALHSRGLSRRTSVAVALATSLALAATGCMSSGTEDGEAGDGKGEITFWDNNGGVRTEVWKKIIAAFEKENPDIEVTYVPVPIKDVQSKYDTAIQGGGLPDVGVVSTSYLANMVAQQALEPLGERIAGSGLRDRLTAGMVAGVRAAGGQGEEMFSVPTSANQGTLWYRTDLFDKAGLQPPRTWDAFYQAAEALTDRGSNQFGFTIRGGEGSIAQALEMMYAQSGIEDFWDGDRTTVNDPANVAALEKYAALYDRVTPKADLNNDFTKMVATFTGGTVGMLQHNLGSYTDHVKAFGKENVAGVPVPPSEEGGPRTLVSQPVDGLGIFRSSKEKDAAWKFVEFAASAEMNSLWNESAGQIPAHTGAAEADWLRSAPPVKAAMDSLADEDTKIVQLPYYLPDWNNISKSGMEPDFQKVLLGDLSAKEFCDELAEQLNAAQAEWEEQNR